MSNNSDYYEKCEKILDVDVLVFQCLTTVIIMKCEKILDVDVLVFQFSHHNSILCVNRFLLIYIYTPLASHDMSYIR